MNILLTITILSFTLFGYAQSDFESFNFNSLYVEFGGNAAAYSINFDKTFTNNSKHNLGIRIGCGYFPVHFIFIPILVNYYYGKENHILEIGGGIVTGYVIVQPSVSIGYRFKPKKRNIFFKAAFTPIRLPVMDSSPITIPWVCVSIGYLFKNQI